MEEFTSDMIIRIILIMSAGFAFTGLVMSIRELIQSTKEYNDYKRKSNG